MPVAVCTFSKIFLFNSLQFRWIFIVEKLVWYPYGTAYTPVNPAVEWALDPAEGWGRKGIKGEMGTPFTKMLTL